MNNNDKSYNGWKNYETWNVWLWITNKEGIYALARSIAKRGGNYDELANELIEEFDSKTSGDSVAWDSPRLDRNELNNAMVELLD
jgi:hypothetical protein